MEVKGTFFVGRKQFLVHRFGEPAWTSFLAALAEQDALFRGPILATTMVPVASYLRFQEETIRRFFGGDDRAYWQIGEKAGEWALTEGPYKNYRQNQRDFGEFVARSLPQIWSSYFNRGELKTWVADGAVEGQIVNLPVWHVSFEFSVMGFMRRAIELVGFSIKQQQRVLGVSAGDKGIHYRFVLELGRAACAPGGVGLLQSGDEAVCEDGGPAGGGDGDDGGHGAGRVR